MTKAASPQEAAKYWDQAKNYWDAAFPQGGPPWVEASFRLQVFKVTLRQRGLHLPAQLNVAYLPEGHKDD